MMTEEKRKERKMAGMQFSGGKESVVSKMLEKSVHPHGKNQISSLPHLLPQMTPRLTTNLVVTTYIIKLIDHVEEDFSNCGVGRFLRT
jgi:hypothetical protein